MRRHRHRRGEAVVLPAGGDEPTRLRASTSSKRLLVGRARPVRHARRAALPKRLALPVFAADSLSSVAYATEEALLVLPAASVSAATLLAPFSIGVARLRSPSSPTGLTDRAYSTSGGACVVAKDNFGPGAALTNGQPLYLKWLLLLEPRVLLANVPFRLD